MHLIVIRFVVKNYSAYVQRYLNNIFQCFGLLGAVAYVAQVMLCVSYGRLFVLWLLLLVMCNLNDGNDSILFPYRSYRNIAPYVGSDVPTHTF